MSIKRIPEYLKGKNIILAAVLTVLMIGISGCGQSTGGSSVTPGVTPDTVHTTTSVAGGTATVTTTVSTIPGHTITIQDAKNLLDTDKTVVFIDVRDQTSYDENHISGAILIPLTEIQNQLSEIPKDKQVVVYAQCH